MSIKTFKSLMSSVDDDHRLLENSEFPRRRIYYDVYLDDRKSAVITRKFKDRYNNKISFLVCVDHDINDNHQSMLYLTDLDIIETLLSLDDDTFSTITKFFVSCSLNTAPTDNHVVFKRKELHNGFPPATLEANSEVLHFSIDKSDTEVKTPYGIAIKLISLCDLICLILSSENMSKRKIIATKYYVLSHIIRNSDDNLPINSKLGGLNSMQDVKKIYERKRTVEDENEFDRSTFEDRVYTEYFESLA